MWMHFSIRDVSNFALALAFLPACGGAYAKSMDAAAPAPPMAPESAPTVEAGDMGMERVAVAQAQSATVAGGAAPGEGAPAPDAAPVAPVAPVPTTPDSPPLSDQQVLEQAKKMVDIEAHLSIEVKDVRSAVGKVHALAKKSGAVVTNDTLSMSGDVARAEIALRVPAAGAGGFLDSLEEVGWVQSRQVTEKDVGKQFYDATIRLSNLEVARKRYEEILARAANVDEVLRVEAELNRVRGEIEQLKGELRFLKDRAARATIYVTRVSADQAATVTRPSAKFYPGVRLSYLLDFRGDDGDAGYVGGGFSAGLGPHVAFEVLGFRALDSDTSGLDGLFLTVSGRVYSEYLGNGTRETFNPYFGLRGGYAHFVGEDEILLGGGIGLEIFKTETFLIDSELRAYGLFGSDQGGHLGLEPSVGVSFAF
jgi:hypothetical protein